VAINEKIQALVLSVLLCVALTACGGSSQPPAASSQGSGGAADGTVGDTADGAKMAVLLHRTGDIDDRSFVQGRG